MFLFIFLLSILYEYIEYVFGYRGRVSDVILNTIGYQLGYYNKNFRKNKVLYKYNRYIKQHRQFQLFIIGIISPIFLYKFKQVRKHHNLF